jgi:Protein of unknown function (DUF3592)
MEIIFLLVGLAFMAVGILIVLSELRARGGTQPMQARVIGFSNGRSKDRTSPSFYSVAEYVGSDGRKYYVEGSVGSSVPLHTVGDPVTVLVRPTQPETALVKSSLSYVLGIVLALMGLACTTVFWFMFQASTYSLVTAVVIAGVLALKIKGAWRKQPLSLEAWREYKKQVLSPRVFTDESKEQISWADPVNVAAALRNQEKSRSVAVPVLFLLGFGLMFGGYHFYEKTEAFLKRADHTSGQVVDLRQNDSADDATTYAAVVEYSDHQGANHKFVDSFSSNPPSYRPGQTVNVLYNRENPLEAQIDRGRANYWLSILLGFAGVMFTLLGLSSSRKRRQEPGNYRPI